MCRTEDRVHELAWASDAVIFILVVVALCVSLVVAWRRSRGDNQHSGTRWRTIALRLALTGNTLSVALLCIFLILAMLAKFGMLGASHWLWVFSFLFWIGFSLATVVLGAFGRGLSRFLVMVNGVVLACLWYVLGLANSP